jgi:hypothetical protein
LVFVFGGGTLFVVLFSPPTKTHQLILDRPLPLFDLH